ncbi:MAG: hypothetical protein QNJ12_19215 [Ilumatobacter sp.]|nr:hypothetical protein [Ilumatobacter sp.]MDJ0770931.1 hypothetical protein [Ilumatobacter sp.]
MNRRLRLVFQTTNPQRLADLWRGDLGYGPEPPPEGLDSSE